MRKSPLILLGTFLLLSLLMPPKSTLAAPQPQEDDPILQIVLVLDVSGSMSTPVYTGLVPEDLLSLLLRLNELNQDPEYLDLQDQLNEAENDPAVQEAKDKMGDAFDNLGDWIGENQASSLAEVRAAIRGKLGEFDCESTSDGLIATSGYTDQIMRYLTADCPPSTNKWTVLAELLEIVTYLEDPDYKAVRAEWRAASRDYDQALEDSGQTSLSDRLEAYKRDLGMSDVQDEIDLLVVEYGIPSRLDLAKSAAINLIDLSILDEDRTGRESQIGLVTFSNQALLDSGLTLDHEILKPLISSMVPLAQTNIGDGLSVGLTELENNADDVYPMMVILLSDGHANVGMSSSEILATIPNRANNNDIILCTAGFADLETEVDFLLLEGLAFETEGEYLFTNSGAELGSFFAACREAAAGNELVSQFSGVVPVGDIQEIGQVDVEPNTCELTFVLNYLSGSPLIELSGPEGEVLNLETKGVEYQTLNQVQLLTIADPGQGEWSITLSNQDKNDEDAVFSLVISAMECEGGIELPKIFESSDSSIPFLLTNRGMSVLTGGLIGVIVILGTGVVFLIRFRQRRIK